MSALVFGRALRQATGRRLGALCSAHSVNFAPRLLIGQPAAFSTAASKVAKTLVSEVKHEEGQYEQSKEIKAFLKNTPFTFTETGGDVNMVLEREIADKVIKIEWQLTSPFDPTEEEGEDGEMEESTALWVTVENKSSGNGLTFNCSTQTGEDHRYVIGSVKAFSNAEEKESVSGYNGPDFEDLDHKLQEGFDEYLGELGMSSEVCDFIDAMALDKEQREYVRWLTNTKEFLEA
jgi:complement component 1 Q subcomponent-binding protein